MAFSDIFNPATGQFYNGSFKADAAFVFFGGFQGVGLLVQNINFSYAQQISRIYEVGSSAVYLVAGRSQGNAGVARIVGPTPLNLAFIRQFADVCRAGDNDLWFHAEVGCKPGQPVGKATYWLQGCVLTTIAVALTSTDMVINEQMQMMFTALDLLD